MPEGTFNELESIKSEKEILWNKKRDDVNEITDRLGKHIEEHIKEAVVAFQIYGFSTSQSCEGHLVNKGISLPWVEIYVQEPNNWRKSIGGEREKLEEHWKNENLIQRQKMADLLTEFYQTVEAVSDTKLVFRDIGIFGGFRIQNSGAENIKSLSKEERQERLNFYRQEMDSFVDFLKKKFFKQ